jgi:hypothetical protein
MPAQPPELAVIGAAKTLAGHVFKITQGAPKQYRFSLSGRMQNMALELVRLLYSANETYVDMKLLRDMDKSIEALAKRKKYESDSERFFMERHLKGEMDFPDISQRLNSWLGHAEHGHTWHLRRKIFARAVFTRNSEKGEGIV